MNLRPHQQEIVNYNGGLLAVSAVPGSGKTHTLAALVTKLLQDGRVRDDGGLTDMHEILVVTFTNSAVDNIKTRIRKMLNESGLAADVGYRVFTLHGLANTILKERPDLAGTTTDYKIDDELSGQQAMPEAARWFIANEPAYWQSFLPGDLPPPKRQKTEDDWRDKTTRMGYEVTKLAKNLRLSAADVAKLIRQNEASFPVSPFLRIGAAIYERYERILNAGGRLDFDDLIWGAIRALENDDLFRARLGARWQFILEDEAQDSTPLQEVILKLLSREHGNWVRVGDPNQAIMTTFTASDVKFFRAFTERPDVLTLSLPVSGRSAQPIMDLANRLADWAVREHPLDEIREQALDNRNPILPTDADDTQTNPPAERARVHVQPYRDEDDEVLKATQSAVKFVLAHPDKTCAVLAPTNFFGKRIVDLLLDVHQPKHPDRVLFQDQLKNPQTVRDVAKLLAKVVRYCAVPANANALAELRDVLQTRTQTSADPKKLRTLIRSAQLEKLLFPSALMEPALSDLIEVSAAERTALDALAKQAAKWLRASQLPIDQLLLTVAQDVLTEDNELAIAHSLAVSLRRYVSTNPQVQLIDLAYELEEVATNKRKYLSDALIESGFEPLPGVITVTTMHKAKGLEWDRVYLVCVDEIEFPHDPDVNFRGQAWYLGGHDPATEARKELEMLASASVTRVGDAGLLRAAHLEYIAERLRLLYVGITRAKTELAISYSQTRLNKENELPLVLRRVLS